MGSIHEVVTQADLMTIVIDYVNKSSGLSFQDETIEGVCIHQKGDHKSIKINKQDLADVIVRKDVDGREFIQVNLASGQRLLLTENLIGFKPLPVSDLDISKLPKVVTTADLISVFEAIEETIANHPDKGEEVKTLKKIFQAIVMGGEDVGFDLAAEKSWIKRLAPLPSRTTA